MSQSVPVSPCQRGPFDAEKTIHGFIVFEPAKFLRQTHNSTGGGSTTPRTAARLGTLLAKALGSFKADKARKNVYHVDEGCVQVRQTMPVDHFFFPNELCDAPVDASAEPMALVDSVFCDDKDALIVVAGFSGTPCRSKQIHGNTLDLPTCVNVNADSTFTFVPPPQESWGMMLHTVNYTLQKAAECGASVSATAVRIQLDNVVDALISPSALKVKFGDPNQGQRVRQQYTKLLALTSASTLDVDDDSGVARITDQTVVNLQSMADYFHIVNCFSAGRTTNTVASAAASIAQNSSAGAALKRGSAPSHCLTTLRVSFLNGEVRRIHFLETADLDWTSQSKEDQEEYSGGIDNLVQVVAAIAKNSELVLDAISRKFLITHILCSQLRLDRTKILFYGHTRYAHSLEMMRVLARATNQSMRTVLHGPDLEGEMEVDVELRRHLEDIQLECEQLQREIDEVLENKRNIDTQIRSADEKMARIEQRRATMRRMSFASRRRMSKTSEGSQGDGSSVLSSGACRGVRERDFINAARCYTLREELKDLQRTHVKVMRTVEKQAEMLASEKSRSEVKVTKLQAEYDKARELWKHTVAAHEREREETRKQFMTQMSALLDARRHDAEKKTQATRQAQLAEEENCRRRAEEAIRAEKEATMKAQLERTASAAAEEEAKKTDENRRQQIKSAQDTLAGIEDAIQRLQSSEDREDTLLDRRLKELEQAAAVLNEFAFRMSALLSTIEKRMHHSRMIRVAVHEPQLKENAEIIRAKTQLLTNWLASGGLHGGTISRRDSMSPVGMMRHKASSSPSRFGQSFL